MRADDTTKWIVADDLEGCPRVPAPCRQKLPGIHCSDPLGYVCDNSHCGKPVCYSHRHDASMPRLVDRDRDAANRAGVLHRWLRDAHGDPVPWGRRTSDGKAPDLCTTCHYLERGVGSAFEEISAQERRAFLFSEAASGYIGPYEYATFPELGEHQARIHGEEHIR